MQRKLHCGAEIFGAGLVTLHLCYEDGAFLSASTVLVYSTPVFEKIYGAFRLDHDYNADKYSKDAVMEIGDPRTIFDAALKDINGAGYQLEEAAYDYYALDHETMAKEYRALDKSGNEISADGLSWGAENDCYFFAAVQQHEGLPVYFGSQDFPEDSESNRPVQVLYSAGGIERLEVSRLYSFSEPGDAVSLLDFGTVAETVSKKYGDVIGASYTVKRAKLYKMPVRHTDSSALVYTINFNFSHTEQISLYPLVKGMLSCPSGTTTAESVNSLCFFIQSRHRNLIIFWNFLK